MTRPGRCEPRPGSDDEGGALIAAVMFGALSCLLALSLVGRMVVEGREVANSLMQVRAYWAAMGIDAYAMSRTAQSGWCTSPCDAGSARSNVTSYVSEVGDLANWRYPDVGSSYSFTLKPTVTAPSTGNIQVSTAFRQSGSAPAVANMTITRPLELQFQASSNTGWGTAKGGNGATMSISSLARPGS